MTPRRERVLAALRASRDALSTREVARAVEAHPNSARLHLEALVRSGVVERVTQASSGRGRPAHVYRARGVMDPTGPQRLGTLAAILVKGLSREPQARHRAELAGQAWGREAAEKSPGAGGVNGLHRMLDEFGFRPDPVSARQINLRHCPFLEVAREESDVVCAVHLGIMQGYVEATGSTIEIESLDPLVRPDLCVAHWREVNASASAAAAPR